MGIFADFQLIITVPVPFISRLEKYNSLTPHIPPHSFLQMALEIS